MASLLENWRYQEVPTLPFMELQNGDRVKHFLGHEGTVTGYDYFSPGWYYVRFDYYDRDGIEGSYRSPASSLEKIDD